MLQNLSTEAKVLTTIGILTILLLICGVWFLNKSSVTSSTPVDTSILVRSDSFQTGTGIEKVVIVEFADFQCPACQAASHDIEKIAADYKGQVTVVFRNFPLGQHPHARQTAAFAESAGQQGKFWEAYKKLFETQSEWSSTTDIESVLDKFTTELQLNPDKTKQIMVDSKTNSKIQRDYDDGVKSGVNSTPTIFINGEKLMVFPTYEVLKQKIEEKLNK